MDSLEGHAVSYYLTVEDAEKPLTAEEEAQLEKLKSGNEGRVKNVNNYSIKIEVEDGKVKELMEKIDVAQRVIYECYCELESLGVLVIKEKPTSGN